MKGGRAALARVEAAGRRASTVVGGARHSTAAWLARLASAQAAVAGLLAQSTTLYLVSLAVLVFRRRR